MARFGTDLEEVKESMTDQEKQNVARILQLAKGHMATDKRKAVGRGDFDTSLRIASNEARVEAYFRERGVDLDEGRKSL